VGDSKIASRWLNATVPIYDGPDADHKGREICFDSAVTGFVTGSHTMSIVYGFQTTTRIFDVRDLDAPVLVDDVAHETTSIGHNTYSEGRYAFASNYTAGLRVFDITGVADGEMPQVAYFDVYPANDNASFEGGTWSNYPYFHQKKVVAVTSMDSGLFVLQPRIGS
jgi:choice-of-anchor B domain-containing protein